MKNWIPARFSYWYLALLAVLISAVIFTASALISMSYEKAIVKYLNGYLKEHLTTTLSMDENIRFRFLKGFPNTTIEINNVLLHSGTDFSRNDFIRELNADTLLYARSLFLRINPFKMLRKDYEIKKIEISGGILNILFDQNNSHNLKIWKSDPENNSSYSVGLRNITVSDTRVRIVSLKNNLYFDGNSVRTLFKGGLSASMLSGAAKGHFRISRLLYKEKPIAVHSNLQLDINMIYSSRRFKITSGTIQLNKAIADISGEYLAGKTNDIDLSLNMHQLGLSELMSVLPIKPEAGGYSFSGGGKMNLSIKGPLSNPGKLMISSEFMLHNCQARNTSTRAAVTDISLNGSISGNSQSNFHLRVDTFNARMGKGRIAGNITIKDLNRLYFLADLQAFVDLKELTEFIGSGDSIQLAGLMNSNFKVRGSFRDYSELPVLHLLRSIQQGSFAFSDAALAMSGLSYKADKITGTAIWKDALELDSFRLKVNGSDVALNGTIENLNAWIAGTGYLKPNLSVTCDIINISKYLRSGGNTPKGSNSSDGFFPHHVYLRADVRVQKFTAGKFEASDVSARISAVADSMLMEKVVFKFPDGSITGKAVFKAEPGKEYSLACIARPERINIRELFYVFNNFTQSFILDKNLRGELGGNIDFYARWDSALNILPSSVKAIGDITITNGELVQFEPMLKLSKYIDVDELKHIRFKTLRNSIYINERLVSIPEMSINSTAFNISVSGQHSFDNLFDYRVRVLLSEVLFNKARKKKHELNEFFVEESPADQTTIPLMVAGTPSDFDVRFDRKKAFSLSRNRTSPEIKPKADNFRVEWEEPVQDPAPQTRDLPESSGVVIEWDE